MPKAWTRDDTLLVLASYLDRPRGMRIPPQPERERVANLVRRDLDAVTDRYQAFADVEAGDAAGPTVTRLWQQFGHRPLDCAIEADEVLEARKRVPYHLRKRLDQP
ncbi:MAG: hypothetical protein ACPHID_01070 [Thermoplasmatota archaeon]